MKILNKYLLVLALFALVGSQPSCKKEFLELEPKGFIIAKTTKDYEQLMNATFLASVFTASCYLGDEMAAQHTYFDGAQLRTQRLFKYEDRVYNEDELPLEMTYAESYIRRLYIFNKVINEVMQSEGGTFQQKKQLLAEAKVGRAVCNLSFQSDFSKPYNAATAETDLGIPLVKEADVTLNLFIRANMKECYDFMIKDLTEALPDLAPVTHRRKFSKAAAEFYLTRIYLYMANFAEAKTHIDGAFAALAGATIPLALYDYNIVLDPNAPGTWFPDNGFGYSNKPLASANSQVIYNIETSGVFYFAAINTFPFSPQTALLFDPADKRLLLYSDTEIFGTFVFPKGMRRYPGFSTDIGPSLPDMYLMRAELKARANDLQGAKADLELLRVKRMPLAAATVPASIASNQVALVKYILEERIREFPITGLRWLDMRRLSVDPIYNTTVKYTHEMYDDTGNVVETYTLKPERFAMKFGERMLAENPGLVENP